MPRRFISPSFWTASSFISQLPSKSLKMKLSGDQNAPEHRYPVWRSDLGKASKEISVCRAFSRQTEWSRWHRCLHRGLAQALMAASWFRKPVSNPGTHQGQDSQAHFSLVISKSANVWNIIKPKSTRRFLLWANGTGSALSFKSVCKIHQGAVFWKLHISLFNITVMKRWWVTDFIICCFALEMYRGLCVLRTHTHTHTSKFRRTASEWTIWLFNHPTNTLAACIHYRCVFI